MAILVVRSSPSDLASIARSFPAEPIMVSEARRLAAQTFGSWGMDAEQIDLACLLVSEVVTNAVLHASITPSPGPELDFDLDPVIMSAQVAAPRVRAAAAVGAAAAPRLAAPLPVHSGPVAAGGHDRTREFALRLRRGASSVWVEVFDADLRLPRIRTAAETDEGGRGLYLVEQLATRWGSRPTTDGKAVWFEMPRSGRR
jgi:hypothetical protein